jgi:hypothetical protein
MRMKNLLRFLVCVVLAASSFVYARYHYRQVHSLTVTNPFKTSQKAQLSEPFYDREILGSWVKDEWVFAIAVPALLIGAGMVLSARK